MLDPDTLVFARLELDVTTKRSSYWFRIHSVSPAKFKVEASGALKLLKDFESKIVASDKRNL